MTTVVCFAAILEVYNPIEFYGGPWTCRLDSKNYLQINQNLRLALHMVIGTFLPYILIAILNVLIVLQRQQFWMC